MSPPLQQPSIFTEGLFIYVDASSNEISNALTVTSLKVTSSTTSDALVPMLLVSNKTPAVVAGKSDMVTAATIRRAIEDAGAAIPRNGQLVIVGQPRDFEGIADYAKSRGLMVDVMPPMKNDANSRIVNEPIAIAPSKDPTTKLQEQIQMDNNNQMNQLLRGAGNRQ